MARFHRLHAYKRHTRWMSVITAGFMLLGAIAPASSAYTPPANSQAPRGPSIPAGKRGNCHGASSNESDLGLLALAPQQHIGQTLSTQPTLTWFVPDEATYQIELKLYQQTADGFVDVGENLRPNEEESHQGYMSYTVPASLGLTVSEYHWHVILICSPEDRSRDQVVGGVFEVVRRPNELATVTGDHIEQARQYANAGLWYDAIALLSGPWITEEARAYRSELLMQLAEYEDIEFGSQLRQLAEME